MRNNPDIVPPHSDALLYIRTEREKVRTGLRTSSQRIKTMTTQMFAPPVVAGRTGTLVQLFNQGMALYKGITLGLAVVRGVRRIFKK